MPLIRICLLSISIWLWLIWLKEIWKHFGDTSSKTTPKELIEYLENSGIDFSDVEQQLLGKHIPPEDLTKEFPQ